MTKTVLAFLLSWFAVFAAGSTYAFAASATLDPEPQSGSFGKAFSVNMVVDGHGQHFNAAQATVTLSPNLKVTDLTLGDCNLSYLQTPSIQNPSFAGIIISSYSTRCTAYTLTVAPIAKGTGTIVLSKASIKRYGDASEILSAATDASYTLTGVAPTGDTKNENTSRPGLYTLSLKVTATHTAVPNATVTLSTVSSKNTQRAITDNTGAVQFLNLQTGVYDAVVTQKQRKTAETIVNVSGKNHVLSLGIDLSTQNTNPLLKSGSVMTTLTANPLFLIGALIVGVIVGVGVALLIVKLLGKRK